MRTFAKLILGIALSLAMFGAVAEELVGQYYLRSTQVVKIKDAAQDRIYHITIQTPFGYEEGVRKGQKYPAMYITDMAYNYPMVEGWMNVATYGNTIQKHLLVGISWEVNTSSMVSRTYDYTPVVEDEWKDPTGGADSHLRFLKEQVFPYVENKYSADPAKRTYVGSSLGGLFGAYALLTQPDLFANYLLVSPSLWYNDHYMFQLEASKKRVVPKQFTQVFISAGELETPKDAGIKNNLFTDAQKFAQKVQAWQSPNVSIQFYPVKDAFHSMTFPDSIVRGISWMLKEDEK